MFGHAPHGPRSARLALLSPVLLAAGAWLGGCGGGGSAETQRGSEGSGANPAAAEQGTTAGATAERLPFKIGLMTGTVSQGEDEYRAGEAMIRRYGDRIRHVTYPDNFMTEQETMIAQILNLAADSEVKAIIIAQGVPGSMAAIKKVREQRPDMLFLLDNPHEDPNQISNYADLSLIPDELRRGETIIDLAHQMGAKAFVHYSFPRHMSQELLSRRKEIMEKRCAMHGMKFVFVNAPDPTGDQGLPGAQKFILEDVPRQVQQYGKDTAFFSTNCGMQEPLIRSVMDNGALFPEQCCPSPTHGYPGALGIAITADQAGDMGKIREAIAAEVVEHGEHGRMATWPVSITMVTIEAQVELAIKALKQEIPSVKDQAAINAELKKAAGANVYMVPYEGKDNYFFILLDSIIF